MTSHLSFPNQQDHSLTSSQGVDPLREQEVVLMRSRLDMQQNGAMENVELALSKKSLLITNVLPPFIQANLEQLRL